MTCPHCGKRLQIKLLRRQGSDWHMCVYSVLLDPIVTARHETDYLCVCWACGEPVS